MIGGPNSSLLSLTWIYQANRAELETSLARIASGKRIQNPSDDFAGYLKAQDLETDIEGYQTVKQNIQEAKGLVDYAAQVGNDLVADFNKLKTLKDLYTQAGDSGDLTAQSAYEAEYEATITRIYEEKTESYFNNVKVYRAGVQLETVKVNPENSSLAISVQATAVGNEAAISNIANVADGDIQNELANAQTYAEQMTSFSTELQQQINLADTAINSKEATISAITDIDEVQEMSNLIALQVRQQATLAMMAQANALQGYVARLYGGSSTVS